MKLVAFDINKSVTVSSAGAVLHTNSLVQAATHFLMITFAIDSSSAKNGSLTAPKAAHRIEQSVSAFVNNYAFAFSPARKTSGTFFL